MTYPPTTCFLLTPTNRYRRELRRYARRDERCTTRTWIHDASVVVGVETHATAPRTGLDELVDRADPRWPRACACGYVFTDDDAWQVRVENVYTRSDGGPETTLHDAPAGAIWDAWWWPDDDKVDGKFLVVRLPNGRDWAIDSVASNCTRPGEKHQCWVRHGDAPRLTVDKDGDTCAAGAGSILAGDYHGFLRDGVLVSC